MFYQSQASSWLTLQRKAARSEAMSEQVLGEEPYSGNGLCQYAQKMTACFGHLGKKIKDVHVDFFGLHYVDEVFSEVYSKQLSVLYVNLQSSVSKLCVSKVKKLRVWRNVTTCRKLLFLFFICV